MKMNVKKSWICLAACISTIFILCSFLYLMAPHLDRDQLTNQESIKDQFVESINQTDIKKETPIPSGFRIRSMEEWSAEESELNDERKRCYELGKDYNQTFDLFEDYNITCENFHIMLSEIQNPLIKKISYHLDCNNETLHWYFRPAYSMYSGEPPEFGRADTKKIEYYVENDFIIYHIDNCIGEEVI